MGRVAMLSLHTCPLAVLGGKETGGMNVYVRELARALGRRGDAVDVFTRSQNPEIPRVASLGPGARVIHLPAGPEMPLPKESLADYAREFVERLDSFRVAEGVEYAIIHSHYWLSGLAAGRLKARWGVPVIQMFHTLGKLKNRAGGNGGQEPARRILGETEIIGWADRIVAPTPIERAHLVWYYGAPTEKIDVIPCGVDTALFSPMDPIEARRQVGLDDQRVLLFVGRLDPIKGAETLLRAFVSLRRELRESATLLVVGGTRDDSWNGTGEAARLRRLTVELGIDASVRFLGPLPQERLSLYYAAADCCLMPSYYESFGMVALEAMACGTPVIASRVGGLATTVQDGVTGYLVPEGNPEALAERTAQLLRDDTLRRRLGAEALRWARQFQWETVAEAICALYGELAPGEVARTWRCEGR